jgi:hypothetical protein
VPERLRPSCWTPPAAPGGLEPEPDRIDMVRTRTQIHEGKKITLNYRDEHGRDSQRTIWPIAVGYLKRWLLAAWRELRKDFAVSAPTASSMRYHDEKYPERDICRRNGGAAWLGSAERYLKPDAGRDRLLKQRRHAESPPITKAPPPAAPLQLLQNWPRFTIEDDSAPT